EAEQLSFAQRGAEFRPVDHAGARAGSRREGHDHRRRPAPAVGVELFAPLERGAGEIPGGGVSEARESRESGPLQMRLQLPCQRMYWVAGGAPAELLTPPLQARMGYVMIDAGSQARSHLLLDPAERGQHWLLGIGRVEPGEEARSVGLRSRGHRSARRRRWGAAAGRWSRAPAAAHRL